MQISYPGSGDQGPHQVFTVEHIEKLVMGLHELDASLYRLQRPIEARDSADLLALRGPSFDAKNPSSEGVVEGVRAGFACFDR